MERARLPAELLEQIRRLGSVLRAEGSAHLRRAFAIFLTKVLLPKKTGRGDFPEVTDLTEVERMILEGKHEWADNWLKEGIELGEKRGIELGIELGEKRGEKRGQKRGMVLGTEQTKRDNAVRMLNKGMSVNDVAECVDLPEEEIRRIAKETRH